jgi:hypothetical protein
MLAAILFVAMFLHHGTGASYQMDKKVTLKGTVTDRRRIPLPALFRC